MRRFIVRVPRRYLLTGIYSIFTFCLLMVIAPPLYLWSSGQASTIFGMPVAVGYWIFNWAFLGAMLWMFYWIEEIRGDIPEDESRRFQNGI